MRTLLISIAVILTGLLAGSCDKEETAAPPAPADPPAPTEPAVPHSYTVSTLAGSGIYGFADGHGEDAAFREAYGLATDAEGNLYVADSGNNRIRKITPDGWVTTVAGDSAFGSANGTAAQARFNYPHGLVVDGDGNIYVADAGNSLIRKISPDGIVTTLAGSGAAGFKNGRGKEAAFNFPADIVLDPDNNLYVSDGGNACIRKITPDGVVSTFATGFGFPEGMEIDKAGNLYVADAGGFVVRKVTPQGVVSILAGSTSILGYVDGNGADARFHNPEGIAIDGLGNLYVGDLNAAIRKITPAGIVSTIAGTGVKGFADGTGPEARFSEPSGMAIDPAGNLYVGDVRNLRIRKIQL
ncbi:NHL repeat-containing protein [Dyadobacter soli]|nr:NHL repeat-containing protein [Dyadobacter soli]